jgi:hypothetical protein
MPTPRGSGVSLKDTHSIQHMTMMITITLACHLASRPKQIWHLPPQIFREGTVIRGLVGHRPFAVGLVPYANAQGQWRLLAAESSGQVKVR